MRTVTWHSDKVGRLIGLVILLTATLLAVAPASAQQVTGVPGSPSATTTIDGKQLPPQPPTFGGVINDSAKDSKPWWAPRIVPPKGAPNVLLIMTDDQGYGVSGTFGGVIPTPSLDRIADSGLRYTQFHSTALFAILTVVTIVAGAMGAHAQGMMLDYAADRVIQKYQTSTCEQLKQARSEGPSEKEKLALEFHRGDAQARTTFIDKIAAPVANKMFECGMFP
jgi:hypothetical protein